jgi:predicted lipoprotein with Yx(FWY)xxD motif
VSSHGGSTAAYSPVLKTAMNAELHQKIIVDAHGNTVYIYKPDGTSATSTVPAALKTAWHPVTAKDSNPTVGSGLSTAKTTLNARDQVSYGRHLLYTFKGDTKPGETNGQGLNKVWYAISATGTPIT